MSFSTRMTRCTISTTKPRQVLDLTDQVERLLPAGQGMCYLFLTHTTAALTTADLDPGTDLDLLDAFAAMVPKLRYRHPHNPAHVGDHIMASLIGASLAIPFENGALVMGTWQRVVLVELDGPRERNLTVTFVSAEPSD